MDEAVQLGANPPSQPFEFESEFDDFPIPSMDSLFDGTPLDPTDPGSGFGFDEYVDLESLLNDPDIFYLPGEDEQFVIPDGDGFIYSESDPSHETPHILNGSNCNSNCLGLESSLTGFPSVSGECKREDALPRSAVLMDNCADRASNDGAKVSDNGGYDRESSGGPVSSQYSGNCGSGVYEVMVSMSPDSVHGGRDVFSDSVVDKNVKMENEKNCLLKRKREHEKERNLNISESITCKSRRSSIPGENGDQQGVGSVLNEEGEKRKTRLMRNRQNAQLSRERKKHYVEDLENKVRSMHSTIAELSSKISFIMAENATLRQQLSYSGLCPHPAPGMYPYLPTAPLAYSWVSCAPYVMEPQGSHVPLVSIPRLKPQQPLSASKTETKKSGGETKVVSISLLSLFYFIMLFGGLVPMVNLKFGGFPDDATGSDCYNTQHGGRVLHAHGHVNGSPGGKGLGFYGGNFDVPDKISFHKGSVYDLKQHGSPPVASSSEFHYLGNASEPLVASLYVPRNDKLVKIDGNLIIHSVLATEKALSSRDSNEKKDDGRTDLAVARDRASALAIPEVGRHRSRHPRTYQSTFKHQKALTHGSADSPQHQYKLSASDDTAQQRFLEGLAGAIIPAALVTNVTAINRQNANANRRGSRRILRGRPVSVRGSGLNITEERFRVKSQESHHGNKIFLFHGSFRAR